MQSIINNDQSKFEVLGGSFKPDINFTINKEGMFPLMVVCALGK